MVFVKKFPFLGVAIVLLCVWFCIPFFKQTDMGYSTRDFNEDMSKLYYDLGNFSQKRGDFEKAIKSYTLALDHNPESSVCLEKLEFCRKQLSYKFNFLPKL